MLDNLVNSLRRGVEQARTRGEEVAQAARLRLEIFQLNRELDGLYGRLGRAYHANADVEVLTGIRGEITRVDDDIAAREQSIADLGQPAEDEGEVEGDGETPSAGQLTLPQPTTIQPEQVRPEEIRPSEPRLSENLLGAQENADPNLPSASSVFQAKRQEEQEER